MGWYATAQSLKNGTGAYGDTKRSLLGECDPIRTLQVALRQIQREIDSGEYVPDEEAKARIAYWESQSK